MRATDEFITIVYEELRAIARRVMSGASPASTLQPTALVHEAYSRLKRAGTIELNGERHFVRLAARVIHFAYVEHCRKLKPAQLSYEEGCLAAPTEPQNVLRVDKLLRELQQEDAEAAEVAAMRYFAGMSVDEVAFALGLSQSTVKRRSAMARSFLHEGLREPA